MPKQDAFMQDFLAQAEQALNSVKGAQQLRPEDIDKAREIQRMYEPVINDLIAKLWSVILSSPLSNESDSEKSHWQGMIDAYVGLIVQYYQAHNVITEQDGE